jgi:hypothetical protein
MVGAALELVGSLFEDMVFFQWGGWAALIVGGIWLCLYAGSQMELADVQACQTHNTCSVSTEKILHVPVRHLIQAAPAASSAPSVPAAASAVHA